MNLFVLRNVFKVAILSLFVTLTGYQPILAADFLLPEISGKYEVETSDVTYAQPDGTPLLATIYRPKLTTDQKLHAVVDVHPGAWNAYDRKAGRLYNAALAASGMVVVAVDFRQGKAGHPLASRDVAAAIRFVRFNAHKLGVDDKHIGVIGSSSGGHLALLTGLKPNVPAHRGTPIIGPDGVAFVPSKVDASVAYIIALWPVSDPIYRYNYAKETKREKLIEFHLNYFKNEANMTNASIQRILKEGEAQSVPPTLVVQAGNDKNIPMAMTKSLLAAYEGQNGYVEYAFFPGKPHAFAHRPSPETTDCINLMISFIMRQLEAATTKPATK